MVHFQDTSVGANFWSWEFGGQGYGNQEDPSWNFGSNGLYDVCMIVGNACNEKDTACRTIDLTGNTSVPKDEKSGFRVEVKPNPFSKNTRLSYRLSEANTVRIRILDHQGRVVRTYGPIDQVPGEHERDIELQDEGPGVYYFQMQVGKRVRKGKLIRIRQRP
jgi:hypothetical protein